MNKQIPEEEFRSVRLVGIDLDGTLLKSDKSISKETEQTLYDAKEAGIVMVPYLLLTDGFSGIEFTPASLLLLLAVGILHTGLAYALYFGSMERLPLQSIAVLSYIDPAAALLFSALLLKEPLTLMNIVGACLIIGSAMMSEAE